MNSISDKGKLTLKVLEGLKNLHSIPKIIMEVNEFLRKDPGNNIKLASIIGKDQGLTTKVLAVANSPLYGLQRKVASLEFALMLMGTEEVRRIVTAVSLSEAIRVQNLKNFQYLEYWKHSMLVGTAAKDISIRVGFADLSGEAFLAGMLHDVGIQIIAQYFNKEFDQIISLSKAGKKFFDAEKEVLGLGHDEIGRFLALKWKLPDEIADAIGNHHTPSSSANHKVLTSIVHLADSMTQEFKIGNCFWDNQLTFDADLVEIFHFESAHKMTLFVSDYKEVFTDTADSIVM